MATPEDLFVDIEDKNGYRCTWSTIGADKVDALKLSVPNAVMYSPVKPLEQEQISVEEPIMCSKCKCLMNPYKFALFHLLKKAFLYVIFV